MLADALFLALKWGVFGNAIFMTVWMGFRISSGHPASWVLFDAFIVTASLFIADRYREEGV